MVRAKFRCDSKEKSNGGYQLRFSAVTNGSVENDNFFKWTPSGQLNMGTINETAAAEFEVWKEYYLDFSPAK
jgi:hypothetical protein